MRRRGVFLAILFSLTAALSAGAGEPPPQLVPLGEKVPQPRRFGLDEIEALPTREVHCPVCEFPVAVPRINALMRGVSPGPWAMHAAARDSDLCPFPGPGKIAFQADIVVCPVCGYAAKHHHFAEAVPAELAQWVTSALKPNLRAVQTRLLGRRVEDMSEDEIVAFFNNQADIPDRLRTEHARIVAAARRAPFLERAELTWRAAWAARHALNQPPAGDFLAEKAASLYPQLARRLEQSADAGERLDALRHLLGKNKSGQNRLNSAERYAARLLLAGVYDRLGRYEDAAGVLTRLAADARERYARNDQDPLWPHTSGKVARADRPQYLEKIRLELEMEIADRQGLLAAERDYVRRAVDLLEDAIRADEITEPESALHHSYLLGDFFRRVDNLPLAAEWFRAVIGLTEEHSALGHAARRQLEVVTEQAGDKVNLLSGIGHEGEFIEKIREICNK